MIAISLCLIFAVFQVAVSDIPPHCRGPPPRIANPKQCCKLPKVFTEEDFKACGIEKPEDMKERKDPDCSKQICLMKRYNLMKDDTKIDKEAVAAFLDKYADAGIQAAVDLAKEKCLQKDLPDIPDMCEPSKIGLCITGVMLSNCPNFDESDDCQKLKNHFEECKQYYE